MEDERKDRDQLLAELGKLRAQLAALEAAQAEAETCKSVQECYLLEMADHIREVFWVFDWQQQRVVYVSPAFEGIWGRTAQEIYRHCGPPFETLHPDDRQTAEAAFRVIAASTDSQQWECRVLRPDGTIRWVSVRACAIRAEDGALARVLGVAEDITERKRSEEALRASEARLRAAVESLPFDFFMLDSDGRYVMQNSVCKEHWGDCISQRPQDTGADEATLALWQDNNRRAMAGEIVEAEVVLAPNGRMGYYHNIITPIRQSNEIRGILGVNIDITARRQAEQALQTINSELEARVRQRTAQLEKEVERRQQVETKLRASEQKYRTLVESAGETIAVVDREGVFQFMNRTAAARLGGRPDELTGKSMWDLFPKALADRQAASIRETIETGRGMNATELVDVSGQLRWYNTTVEPIRDADGKPEAGLVIARDIHDLKEAQQQLEQYQQHVRQAERLASVGTLSATVAHQLTQPLTVIRLSIQFAMTRLKDGAYPPAVVEALRDGLEGVADITARIERFRDYARQSAKANPCRVRLSDVVKQTFRLLDDAACARRMALTTEGVDALPTLFADPKDLEQMCFALVENAIQAADGEKDRRLTVRGQVKDKKVVLSFEDTCGGIPSEDLNKIFDPFFTTKPLGEGTGLGLCIVESMVSRLSGKIDVETKAGEGTTFHVTLPQT
ncbi:MAG: PAS domain S-box protein [Sedimentisphaerales bacterium]|nr:PAS domain S-box protein [Sedimentisphaerales bacterium]